MRIGFLGLGQMGRPMASNLVGQGHQVFGLCRHVIHAQELRGLGITPASSIQETVAGAEVVVSMLPPAAVPEVVKGPGGLLQCMPGRAIHLCMGTLDLETSAALTREHAQADQGYVAAPVFGRPEAAAAALLWLVVGGPEPHLNRCRPIFEAVGYGFTRVGPHPSLAHAIRLGGNVVTLSMELAASELVNLASRAGMPADTFLRYLSDATFRSHLAGGSGKALPRSTFDPADQTLDLAAMELMPQALLDQGVAVPLSDLLQARLQAARARGWSSADLGLISTKFPAGTPPETPAAAPATAPDTPAEGGTEGANPRHPGAQVAQGGPSPETPSPEPQATVFPRSEGAGEGSRPPQATEYRAKSGSSWVTLELHATSHFELKDGVVWAWSQGNRFATLWTSLKGVERAFSQTMFLLVKRRILLRPEAVLSLQAAFGGGGRARVGEHLEVEVSRSAFPVLKNLLGA